MKFKDLESQMAEFISILSENRVLMEILDCIEEIGLKNFYITSGTLYQSIWNHIDGNTAMNALKDIDVFYCDRDDTSKEHETLLECKLEEKFKAYGVSNFDLHNEGRMHLWKKSNENPKLDFYECSEDAIQRMIATVQAIGITKEDGKIKIYAPYGLSDIFGKVIRPIKHSTCSKELYIEKCKAWSKRFDGLTIIEW